MVKKMKINNFFIILVYLLINISSFSYINIYPVKFNERIDNDGAYKTFKLYNSTSSDIRYRIYIEEDENSNNSMVNFIEIYPKSITLKPLEEKEFKIFIKAPKDTKNGKYTAKLVVKEVEIPNLNQKENSNKFLTLFKLRMTGYVGEKENLKIPKNIIDFKNISFFDIYQENIVFSDNESSYKLDSNFEKEKLNYFITDRIDNVYIFKRNNKFGILDKSFNEITFGYDKIFKSNAYGIYFAYNGKFGALDENGKIAIPFDFDYILPFKSNYALILKENKFGLVDKRGNFLVKPLFDEIYYTSNGNYIVKKDNKYIDSNNKVLNIDKIFPTLLDYPIYEKDEKLGIIDLYKLKILENKYSEISLDIDSGVILSNNGKYALSNINNFLYNRKNEYIYNYVTKISPDIYSVSEDDTGLEKIINTKTQFKSDISYNEIQKINDNVFLAKTDDKIDVFTSKNNKIKTIKNINEIIYINDSYIILDTNNLYEIIDVLEDK